MRRALFLFILPIYSRAAESASPAPGRTRLLDAGYWLTTSAPFGMSNLKVCAPSAGLRWKLVNFNMTV